MLRISMLSFVLMGLLVVPGVVLAQNVSADAPATRPVIPEPHPRLGTNLSGPADYNTELPFVDVFRMSRPWISQRPGAGWGKGPELELDEHGWVKRLEDGCFAETLVNTIEGGHYPSGTYTILYDGTGDLDVAHAGRVIERQPGRMLVEVDSSRGTLFIRLTKTDPDDYVRNIRVIMPGFEDTYRTDPFHPVFLSRWQGMASLRFMDWMHTNNSKIATWDDRPTMLDATWSAKGVPLKVMVDLSNRLNADPWFCMPHLADDEYVRRFAEYVRDRLDPELKVYVEYSNELWNGMFEQSRWAGREGVRLGLGPAERPWEAGWHFTARRSVEIFSIWENVFGGTKRLVRVLPTQGANAYISEQILGFEDAYQRADALAIAPYISMNVPPPGPDREGLTTAVVENWTIEQALDHLENESLPEAIHWIERQRRVADKYGVKLIAYEAGQHMVGVAGGENNERVTRLFHTANAHPRMGTIYDAYLDAWANAGGDLLANFSSVSNWSKWGSWGVLQYYDEDASQSPKFMSIMRWAQRQGQDVNVPEPVEP